MEAPGPAGRTIVEVHEYLYLTRGPSSPALVSLELPRLATRFALPGGPGATRFEIRWSGISRVCRLGRTRDRGPPATARPRLRELAEAGTGHVRDTRARSPGDEKHTLAVTWPAGGSTCVSSIFRFTPPPSTAICAPASSPRATHASTLVPYVGYYAR